VANRLLYLARHGAAINEGALSTDGLRQATLLGERLRDAPLTGIFHSPLRRAAQTAAAVIAVHPGVPVQVLDEVGDYLPYAPPEADRTPPVAALIGDYRAPEIAAGARYAVAALERFATAPQAGPDRVDLIVTHSYLVAWFVRHAVGAPPERWLGLNASNAALTAILYRPERPPMLLMFNDMAHLPAELRWTGYPPELRV
jgi:probable phosphoglycerate mutase